MKTLKQQNRPGGGRHLLAVHEAGHAVAVELLGGIVSHIAMGGTPYTAGVCMTVVPVPEELESIADAAGNSAVVLARPDGMDVLKAYTATSPEVAERAAADIARARACDEFIGEPFDSKNWIGLSDEEKILARGCSDRQFLQYFVKAARLLEPNWQRVLKLADELLWTGRVEGDRVREIVHGRALRLCR